MEWCDGMITPLLHYAASNAFGAEPVGIAKRRINGEGRVSVPQPAVVKTYNQSMGDVALLDGALQVMRPRIKGKKWYWPLLVVSTWRRNSI